jgi:hypothetical protein
MSLDWMQSCFELEAIEIDFNNFQEIYGVGKPFNGDCKRRK